MEGNLHAAAKTRLLTAGRASARPNNCFQWHAEFPFVFLPHWQTLPCPWPGTDILRRYYEYDWSCYTFDLPDCPAYQQLAADGLAPEFIADVVMLFRNLGSDRVSDAIIENDQYYVGAIFEVVHKHGISTEKLNFYKAIKPRILIEIPALWVLQQSDEALQDLANWTRGGRVLINTLRK